MILALAVSLGLILFLRGGQLHNYLALEAERICQQLDCETHLEAPQQLPDGGLDFIDLLVQKREYLLCVEVETTARNVLSNVHKAHQLNLPLIVVVPTRKVQRAVKCKLFKTSIRPGGQLILILLLSQLKQAVTNCFPLISTANDDRENKKTNERRQK